jgi:hypothetical protein
LVVMEVDTSTSTAASLVGKPIASGLGENSARRPPKGATLPPLGAEDSNSMTRPWSVARLR